MSRLLVVEDDIEINNLLRDILLSEGFTVEQAFSGSEAQLLLQLRSYDLLILDLMLPGVSGEEIIRDLRTDSALPIIVITAKGSTDTLVKVLDLGADDYIPKPFQNKEVLARVRANLRRGAEDIPSALTRGDIALDTETFTCSYCGEELSLTQKEFEIMKLFIQHPTKVFTKSQLYESVWKEAYFGDDNTITVHISRLRSKFKEIKEGDVIETVWGVGFKLSKSI